MNSFKCYKETQWTGLISIIWQNNIFLLFSKLHIFSHCEETEFNWDLKKKKKTILWVKTKVNNFFFSFDRQQKPK